MPLAPSRRHRIQGSVYLGAADPDHESLPAMQRLVEWASRPSQGSRNLAQGRTHSERVVEIVPPQGWPRIDFHARFLGISRAAPAPGLARREVAVLADRVGRGLGDPAAGVDHGGVHHHLRPVGEMPSDGVPYSVFSLAALVPWTYFSTPLTGSSNSLVLSRSLLTKVYFPRLMIPLLRSLQPWWTSPSHSWFCSW